MTDAPLPQGTVLDHWQLHADPVTALVRLRAAVVRLAHDVDALKGGEDIARRMRDAAMSTEMQEASRR